MNIWFTSDLHFFHDRILEFHPKRKELFGDTVESNKESLIRLWNSRVSKHDTIYILGDLSFGEVEDKRKLFQRLNGNKILYLQFLGACFISGFAGAFFNELLSKIEDLYDEYKKKKEDKHEQEGS